MSMFIEIFKLKHTNYTRSKNNCLAKIAKLRRKIMLREPNKKFSKKNKRGCNKLKKKVNLRKSLMLKSKLFSLLKQ